jgi:hypothetical protein
MEVACFIREISDLYLGPSMMCRLEWRRQTYDSTNIYQAIENLCRFTWLNKKTRIVGMWDALLNLIGY